MTDRNEAMEIEGIELEAKLDYFGVAPPEPRTALGLETARIAGAGVFCARRLDHLYFNRVLGLGMESPATAGDVRALEAFYAGRGVRQFSVNLCPFAAPADLAARLAAAGYERRGHLVKWARDPSPAPAAPTDLAIERVEPPEAARFGEVFVAAYGEHAASRYWAAAIVGREGWMHWFARERGEPVGIAAMYVARGLAWLGWGGTVPSHRGRGGQSALLAARIEAARAMGCRRLVVETGPDSPAKPNPSYRNVERAGFSVAYLRENWVRSVASDAAAGS